MTDTSTVWDAVNNRGDWVLSGKLLLVTNDLETAALISCFTDRVAAPDDVIPDGTNDPRGWWGDDPTYPIGSRMWLLDRRKQDQPTLNDAQFYLTEATQWFIDDGVVASIEIETEWTTAPGILIPMLGASLTFYQQNGSAPVLNFGWVWQQINT